MPLFSGCVTTLQQVLMLETSDFRNLQCGPPCLSHRLLNAAVSTAGFIQHITVLQSLCTAAVPFSTLQYYSHYVLLQSHSAHYSITVTMYCCSPLCLKGLKGSTEHLGPIRKGRGRVLNWYLPQQRSVSINQIPVSQGMQIMCTSVHSDGTNSVRWDRQHVLRQK